MFAMYIRPIGPAISFAHIPLAVVSDDSRNIRDTAPYL